MFNKSNPSVLQLDGDLVRVLTVKRNKTEFSVVKASETKLENIRELAAGFEKKEVALLFPRELAVIRLLEIAGDSKESLQAAIAVEIEDGLPFAKETVAWDSEVLGIKNNKTSILFAVTSDGNIREYAKNILPAGLYTEGIVPSSLALYEAYRLSGSYTKESVLIVEQGKARADIVVVENDRLVASRGFNTKENGPEILENIKQTLASLEHGNTPAKKIIISSSCGKQAELKSSLEKMTGLKVEELLLPEESEKQLKNAGAAGRNWNLLLGTALVVLGFSKFSLDLSKNSLQKTEKMSAIRFAKRLSYIGIASLLFLSIVLGFANGCKRKEVDTLRTELSALSVLSGKQWSQTVEQVFKAVPANLILSELNIDNKGDIILRGNGQTRQDITHFLDSLNKVRGFSAQLGYANDIQTGKKQTVQFQMKIEQKYNAVKK